MSRWYRLDGNMPIQCDPGDVEWDRRWHIQTKVGATTVSTVFLALDHSYGGDAPVLFETLISGGSLDQSMDRYRTKAQAEDGHAAWVRRLEYLEDIGG